MSFGRDADNQNQSLHVIWRLVLCLAIAWSAVAVAPTPALAQEDDEYGNALDWVPGDAAIFSTSLQLKRQVEIIADSNAWKTFREIQSVDMVWQMAESQIMSTEGPAAMFWQLMELPENQQLAKMLGEMVSEEIVFYAGGDIEKFAELVSVMQGSRLAPVMAMAGDDPEPENAQFRMILEAIEEDPELLTVPDIVLAFRIEDADAANTQLKRLEVLVNMMLQQMGVKGLKLEREEIGEGEFLVLNLEGSQISWPEEAPDEFPTGEEGFEKLKAAISEKKLAIALGEWDGYVMLSIAESTEHLAKLGEEPLLADKEEFEKLAEHLEKDVASVSYVSKRLMAFQRMTAEDLDGFAEMIGGVLEESDDVPEPLKERLQEDLPELANDLKKYITEAGAMVGCSLITETGFESYSYNWSPQLRLDASKPLELVNHLGGSPLLAVVGRGVNDPEAYDVFAKWIGKGIGYFEDFALEEMEEDEREEAEKALGIIKPLLKRLNETTREHLVPALADGQSGFVLDADITSKQWHEEMPENYTELPMVEFALVMAVSDAEEFKTAMREYKAILDDAVDAIREADPESIPEDYEIPAPSVNSTDNGTLYAWEIPSDAGLDEQIVPCLGLSDSIAAFATSRALAERVLAENALEPAEEVLSDADEPRGMVVGLDFAGLVEAAEPWVDYAIRSSSMPEEDLANDPEDDPSEVTDITSQVHAGMEILKCFKGVWSETTEEDGVWETYTAMVFEDIEEESDSE
jgi:hypothetical protein